MPRTSPTGTQHAVPELAANLGESTAADVMVTSPKTSSIETRIEDVRAAFIDPHVHMILLTCEATLHGTLVRADLPTDLSPTTPALKLATLEGRTVRPDERISAVHARLLSSMQRRLAVVDTDSTLRGLLCLKSDQTGFCTNESVAARAQENAPPTYR